MYDPSKDTADNERVFSDLYAGKQDSARKGPAWGGPKEPLPKTENS